MIVTCLQSFTKPGWCHCSKCLSWSWYELWSTCQARPCKLMNFSYPSISQAISWGWSYWLPLCNEGRILLATLTSRTWLARFVSWINNEAQTYPHGETFRNQWQLVASVHQGYCHISLCLWLELLLTCSCAVLNFSHHVHLLRIALKTSTMRARFLKHDVAEYVF